MNLKTIFFALTFISVANTFAQTSITENAIKDVALVPSKDAKPIDDQKPCDIINKSSTRTITVKIEVSSVVNNFLEKKIIAIEKIGPREHKFVGYAGCDDNIMYQKCNGYKISAAYYEDKGTASGTDKNTPSIKTDDKS